MPHAVRGPQALAPAGEPLRLQASALACRRGGRLVFEQLSLSCGAGGAIVVRGPNGAGKSSLLRILAGLLAPAAGSVANPFPTAYLGHENALKRTPRLRDELGFWARLDGARNDAVDGAVARAMERFGLGGLGEVPVRLLSAGQRRRAALARLWAQGATLWLLDEPSVGLDSAALGGLAEAMAEHRARGGLVVAATHVPLGLAGAGEIILPARAAAAVP